jgi:hypothetical protein
MHINAPLAIASAALLNAMLMKRRADNAVDEIDNESIAVP